MYDGMVGISVWTRPRHRLERVATTGGAHVGDHGGRRSRGWIDIGGRLLEALETQIRLLRLRVLGVLAAALHATGTRVLLGVHSVERA
jgi:hypothetical protein